MINLKEWAVEIRQDDPYRAPEQHGAYYVVSGVCDHPVLGSGKRVITSKIVEVNRRIVKTQSGSVYKLIGRAWKPHQDWCKSKGIKCVGQNPFDELRKYWADNGLSVGF